MLLADTSMTRTLASSCHAHPPEQIVLGGLDLELSTAGVEGDMSDARTQIAVLFLITILIISSLVGWLVWRVIQRNIRSLADGTRKLAAGELQHFRTPLDFNKPVNRTAAIFKTRVLAARRAGSVTHGTS